MIDERIRQLIREEIKLSLRKKTPEEITRHEQMLDELQRLSSAGIDELHPKKHYRANIHE